ncbi:MAG: NAD(P)/FAD-dependent oxidoreductase [Lachnospiraceae bacterium]|nr:NAD(P)/FAD-dependent oxidoreductase [Lachnospiraceae bacterium]
MERMIVIGGGAAGMLAAIIAARNGKQVTLLEKNEKLGKKLFITGKGRCNLTNACDMEDLFRNIVTNHKFLYSSLYGFDNQTTMDFFEGLGLHLKTERGNRVFPESDHSSDVLRVLEQELRKQKVQVKLRTEVKEISVCDSVIQGVVLSDGSKLNGDKVIVATGGLSYPSTGSTGDGYRFAKTAGHTIQPCSPSLVPMETEETWCKEIMGLTLKNVSVTLNCGKKKIYEGFGEMLFTHFGVSGPLILSASAYTGKYLNESLVLKIDLKPALSESQLDERLQRDFFRYQNRQLQNAMDDLLPKKLIPIVIACSQISPDKKVNIITREERLQLVQTLKGLPLHITGFRDYKEAIITRGGVNVKEINPQTMESKLVKGLYFAGEVLDVDALTGGFNLQIAWSTGYAAGNA